MNHELYKSPEINIQRFWNHYLFDAVLPSVANNDPDLREAINYRRFEGGMSDIEMAFYSYIPLPNSPEGSPAGTLDRLAFAVDVILCNQRVSFEKRKKTIEAIRTKALSPKELMSDNISKTILDEWAI